MPAGWTLARLFSAVGLLRRGRPLHPKGVVFDAVLSRTGGRQGWGTAWLDQEGQDHGVVRLSRAAGLPEGLPDILGLAFSFHGDDGRRHDLLLATTGLGRDPLRSTYTCLFPYTTPHGSILIGAAPDRPRSTAGTDTGEPISFRMLVALPRGNWQPFGRLTLTARDTVATPLRFDPVVHELPGLIWRPWLAQLREPAYGAARRRTGASGD
jgi:hypothetical protein